MKSISGQRRKQRENVGFLRRLADLFWSISGFFFGEHFVGRVTYFADISQKPLSRGTWQCLGDSNKMLGSMLTKYVSLRVKFCASGILHSQFRNWLTLTLVSFATNLLMTEKHYRNRGKWKF
jgi:hypothetical protein